MDVYYELFAPCSFVINTPHLQILRTINQVQNMIFKAVDAISQVHYFIRFIHFLNLPVRFMFWLGIIVS